MNISPRIRSKLSEVPDRPGCYLMRDRRGVIIYVGKATSLRRRVLSYFRPAARRRGSPKLRSLIHSAEDIEWIPLRTEAEAALTEGHLIKEYRPRFNVSFRDDKRFLLLRVDLREPLPRFQAVRLNREEGATYFGPYPSSAAVWATLDFLEKHFGLRHCKPRIPDAETHRHCLADIVRFCSAPCIGRVGAEAYRQRVEEACAFLRGERPAYLEELRAAMERAAAKLDFEKAAALRDVRMALQRVVGARRRVVRTPEMEEEAAEAGLRELAAELGLAEPPQRIECYDISNISGTLAVGSLVCAVRGRPHRALYRRFRVRSQTARDDAAMMAEVLRRRFSRLETEGGEWPDLVLVDGGAIQLRAACRELGRFERHVVAVAGLAKRREELYLPGQPQPLRLPAESAALPILQRIRDEAHRFALDYHRRLRARRIRESILDDIPGVGPQKKKALLERFGSVARLRETPTAEIASVPGIGARLAETVKSAISSL